jgi:tetratricopeptide (TPR) repeat protein
MGTVFRARRPDGAEVAVKITNLAAERDVLLAFDRERRLLATLGEQDGFVPVLDSGVEGERAFLVMPLLTGGTLRDRMNGKPFSVKEAAELVQELARAMGRAHARGIIHRDLKPANVLFTSKGRPLIADLGLGKHFRRDLDGAGGTVSYSVTGAIAGTTGYMAPEQLEDSKRAGPAADVFALGVILYECVAGARPFLGSAMATYATALRSPAVPLRRRARGVPAWLDALVLRALAFDPKARFVDGEALARALEAGLSKRTVRALPLALVSIGLASLLVAGLLAWGALRPTPPAPPAPAGGRAAAPPAARPAPPVVLPAAPDPEPGRPGTGDGLTADELVKRANEKLIERDLAGALADLDRAVELDPGSALAWGGRGYVKQVIGDLRGAIADYGESIARDDTIAKPWRLRGQLRGDQHDFDGALSDLSRAIALDGQSAMDYQNRGFVRMQLNDLQGALADEDRAIELEPTLESAWVLRGVFRWAARDREAGLADLDHALALNPKNLDALVHRALAFAEIGESARAARDLATASALDPADPRLPDVRARVEELGKPR